MTKYCVGDERKVAETMIEAFHIAVEELGEKEAGKTIRIYRGIRRPTLATTVEILPDKHGRLCYVAFNSDSPVGYALGLDYRVMTATRFPNTKYARGVLA